ncbi:hypothetical protein V7S43_012272 [Phytophthora oleae]|uniref:Reverse transcriptase zinc-binding domain-containing protein n=1 Tax=Phytophthora oleae TaxID=2107226 RepID=A0ABD3F8S1_9STRA
MAAVQLNVFYEGWEDDKSCPLDTGCTTNGRNIAHIAWHCVRAQAWWLRILEHWLGNEVTQADLKQYKDYFSARTAPHIGERLKKHILLRLGNWKKEIDDQLRRIWWAWCSIGTALLWQIRNQVVHEGVKWTAKANWSSCGGEAFSSFTRSLEVNVFGRTSGSKGCIFKFAWKAWKK